MRTSIYKMLNFLQWNRDSAIFLENEGDGVGVLNSTGESAGVEEPGPVHYDPFNDYIDLLAAGIEKHFRGDRE